MKFLIFTITIITFQSLFSQEILTNHFEGVVLDASTNKSIPFAHFTYSKSKGFTSNEKGLFHVAEALESIMVKVSCIGYKTKYTELKANEVQTIYLNRSTEKLDEVLLIYTDEKKELLEKIIENIPKNYPNEKETITGTIREGVFMDSLFQDTIYNAEYDVKFNKLNYSIKRKSGNLSLIEGNAKFYKKHDSIPIIFYGVLHSVHSHDIVMKRNDPLNLNKLDDYKLTIKDTLPYDNLSLIKIAFQSNVLHGNLFIDSESYAIAKGEYWLKGKTSAIEKLNGFERNERYFSVHYDKHLDDKWRLKFIHFLGRYTQKRKNEFQTFYLKDNFIIRGYKPSKELISYNNTLSYETPGVLAENVVSEFNFPNDRNKKFEKKLKIVRFLSKLSFEYVVEAYPVSVQPYSFDFPFLENNVKNLVENRKMHLAFSNDYFYDLSKSLQIELNITKSISKNTLYGYSLGVSKRINLDPYGKFNILLGTHMGNRQIFDNPIQHSFDGNLLIQGKTFKRGEVNIYIGQKEYYFSPQVSINSRLSHRLNLSLGCKYFSPFNSYSSVLIEDVKGLIKKSSSYRIGSKKIIGNSLSYGIGLVLNL